MFAHEDDILISKHSLPGFNLPGLKIVPRTDQLACLEFFFVWSPSLSSKRPRNSVTGRLLARLSYNSGIFLFN